jgi:hypothetical protein
MVGATGLFLLSPICFCVGVAVGVAVGDVVGVPVGYGVGDGVSLLICSFRFICCEWLPFAILCPNTT